MTEFEKQEREITNKAIPTIQHTNDSHYIVNMHSLHQPHLLRKLFKRDLFVLHEDSDRVTLHAKMSSEYRQLASQKAAVASRRKGNGGAENSEAKRKTKTKTKPTEAEDRNNPHTATQPMPAPGFQVFSDPFGRPYYYNPVTNTSTWLYPSSTTAQQQQPSGNT